MNVNRQLRMMRGNNLLALIVIMGVGALLIVSMKPHEQVFIYITPQSQMAAGPLYNQWKSCFANKTNSLRGHPQKTWSTIGNIVRECEQPYVEMLKVGDYHNGDETKRHILPIHETSEKSVIITLGIGHDTKAEENLLNKMGNDSVEFFGADPMHEVNEDLFSKFGNYFPFAVAANPGISKASVLDGNSYRDKLVVNVDAVYFLKKLVGKTFIDDIWLDAEGAEYDLFPYFYRGGEFDLNGITFCQINIEIHLPDADMKKKIHDFLFQMLDDGRYAYFRPVQANHMRLFFVNMEDKRCVEKYVNNNSTTTL